MNRLDLVLKETGHLLDLDLDISQIMYLSSSVDSRVKKRKEQAAQR